MNFHQETLPNGLTILAETSASAVSTSIGFFVRTGSRDESPEDAGVSHFLEHMAFKGDEQYSAAELNRRFDAVGAHSNADTSEEHTVYYAIVLPEYSEEAVDLLRRLLRPSIRDDDFATEQKVILEEIAQYADSPVWTAYEHVMRNHFADHPLGNSVLGVEATVGGLTADRMREYHRRNYGPNNVVAVATGKVDWDAFRGWIAQSCGDWKPQPRPRSAPRDHKRGESRLIVADRYVQQCLIAMAKAPACDSPLRTAADVLASILGDETGSRFHWALVEPGKVDSIDFGFHEYEGVGATMLSMTCSPEDMEENLEEVRSILKDVQSNGVTEAELEQAKTKIAARHVLASERPRNRLRPLGYNWSYRQMYQAVGGELAELRSVTTKQIRGLLDEYPLLPTTNVCLGPLKDLPNLVG